MSIKNTLPKALLACVIASLTAANVWAQANAAQQAQANAARQVQAAVQQLLQNSVEKVDDRYKDVGDAIVMFQRNNPTVALGLLNKAVKEHPELPPAEVLYAHLCFSVNRAEAGQAVLELSAVKHENDAEPWVMLADLAMRAGRLAEADVLFEKALEKTSYMQGNEKRQKYLQVNSHAGLARVDERRGQWEKAEQHLTRWMELQPNNIGAMKRLAGAYFSQKKYDETTKMLTKVREQDENQPLPEVVMGVLHQKNGEAAESEKMMQEALKKGADDVVTRMAIAEWALTAGKTAQAKENADAVLKLNAEAVRAQVLQGKVKRFEGDNAGAEAVFRQIHDKSPASFVASNELALSLLAQDDEAKHKQALQYAQVNAGRYKDPRTARGREAAATFAYGLHRMGQDPAAEKIIQQVITSGEVSPQIGYFAAMIYKSRGKIDIARNLLKRSVESYVAFPEEESARKLLDALGSEPAPTEDETGATEPEAKKTDEAAAPKSTSEN